ncbi:MAG: SDR family oxidoreductase [Deltaproteobacteria bacterium]|nr:SDR family oxidoreductase [Deltaproteobacteria bacterium]
MMQLLILGANSDAAGAVAAKFAATEKAGLYLASRDLDRLRNRAQDLAIRHQVNAEAIFFDATDYTSHQAFYQSLNPKPDGVVLAFGYLGDQELAQRDFAEAERIVAANFLGALSVLEVIAADFERRGHGFIVAFSSVAGERGRQSNYIYGAAKGALTVYLSGLRNRLHRRDVRVITVLPGFIRTKMTEQLNLPARLMAEPSEVAEDVYRAFRSGKDIVYTKWFWKWIMLVIKSIPEKVFKMLKL